ncbi:tripartite tricarboxylate transporter TctB family protein [Devosia sp. BK]|uniref:tripartite tricarboxylate transporter TctB family protein n=1 Tax=Devosia sp. BK TaxID=2871706 RepID=UPI00293A36C0|nr:tripartite tricarboxylate transporter TctB family protein [Devosia sp. BK]MDV3253356.1 tripartite tricarboxylate transporter TctB family protein [Devosia sp. BK]
MRQSFPLDSALGVIFALGGAAILQQALAMQALPGMNVGPGLFPSIVGAGMAIMGVALTIQGWIVRDTPEDEAQPLVTWFAVAIVVALAATILAMPYLGFLVAGTLFAVGIVLLSGGKWLSAVIFSPIAATAIYFTFNAVMRVPLPRGILG